MLALDKKPPLYAYEKGGVSLVKVYSGEAVGETLGLRGSPKPRDVGPGNASVAGTLLLLLLWRLLRAQEEQGKEGEE